MEWVGRVGVLGQPLRAAPPWGQRGPDGPPQVWPQDDWLLRVLAATVRAALVATRQRQDLLALAKVRALMHSWLRPEAGPARFARNPALELLFLLSGWAMALVLTAWQEARGASRRQHSRRRAVGLPQQVRRSLSDPPDAPACVLADWLMAQLALASGADRPPGCVYMLSGVRQTYIGSSGQQSGAAGERRLCLPTQRFGQHLSDIRSTRASAGLRKVATFEDEQIGFLACLCALSSPAP